MAQMATSSTDAVDAVLEKLLSVRGERPGKQVALEDNEIRSVTRSRNDLGLSGGRVDGVFMRPRRLDVVDAAARESTCLVNVQR